MELKHVIYEKRGHVATVTLNRPEASNAINSGMRQDLIDIWTDFKRDDELWVAVLTGAGDQAFCIGKEHGKRPAR
jgi:enoyl-CoA hydratase/carnithine racemase